MADLEQGTASGDTTESTGSTGSTESSSTETSTEHAEPSRSEQSTTEHSTRPDAVKRRDAILAALDKQSGKKEGTDQKVEEGKTPSLASSGTEQQKTTVTEVKKDIDPVTGRELEAVKPPAGLTPALRENWKSVPREFQKFWSDREKQMAQNFQDNAEFKKEATAFRAITSSYADHLKRYSEPAIDHIKGLLTVEHTLTNANPTARAHMFNNLIRQWKPDAKTLMGLLTNKVQAQKVTTAEPVVKKTDEQIADEVLARRAASQYDTQAKSEIEKFNDGTKEFFNDVSPTMQKILNAGVVPESDNMQDMLKAAYEMACAQHPDVKAILAQRATKSNAGNGAAKPTPQVKPSLGAGKQSKVPQKSMSLRDAVLASVEKHSG